MNNSDLEYYHTVTESLGEHMIPLNKFIHQVKMLEDNPSLGLRVMYPITFDDIDDLYTIPYPFTKPLYKVIMDNKQASSDGNNGRFTDADYMSWINGIRYRIGRIINYRMTYETICEVDSNYDIGLILNMITGLPVFFEYSKLKDIELVALGIGIQQIVLQKYKDRFTGPQSEYIALSNYFAQNMELHSVWLNLRYNTPTGDRWHVDNSEIYLTEDIPYSAGRVSAVSNFVHVALAAHKKVIEIK